MGKLVRLLNMHTAPIDDVGPGKVGEFDPDNPVVQIWIRAKRLVSEGELLASRATAIADGPTAAAIAQHARRAELLSAENQELGKQLVSMHEEFERMQARFAEQAAQRAALVDQTHEIARLQGVIGARDTQLAAAMERIKALESDLNTLTAPAATAPAEVSALGAATAEPPAITTPARTSRRAS